MSKIRTIISTAVVFASVASYGCADSGPDGETATDSQEIVGGEEATVGAWPTTVALTLSGAKWCGGTLIASSTVLTAKHCVDGGVTAGQLSVIVGRHDLTTSSGTTRAVSSIQLHPSADVALLQLSIAVTTVSPTRLVAPARMSEIGPGAMTTTVGWGALTEGGASSNTLQEVEVPVVAVGSVCEDVTDYPFGGVSVDDSEICIGDVAGGKDSCQGDSGGPVFVLRDGEQFLLGVTSEGYGCARADLPGIYAFVPGVFEWVHANTSNEPAPSLLPSAQITSILG